MIMWPTKCVELKRIEELLTCGICYEYIKTSVMTLCSHNYCSFCIRKSLHYKTQCPTCFTETFEKDLRKNKILDEIIIQYLNVKETFEKAFSHKEIDAVKCNNSEDAYTLNNFKCQKETNVPDTSEISYKASDSPVSTAIPSTPRTQRVYHQDVSSPSTSISSKIPSMFTPKSKKGFQNEENYKVVICPVCKVDIPENNINKHLDNCLKGKNTKDHSERVEVKRKPLPKLVLSLMKDSAMRKKLKEFGLSSQGDRKILENRLQRYIILYNAECDKRSPRPVPELIKQCQDEENLEKKIQKPSNRLNVNRNMEHNIIEEQRKIYLAENKNSFDQLIAKVRTTKNSRKLPVRRDILSKGNFDSTSEDCAKSRTIKDSKKSDLLPVSYIDDSDSNISCPLQMYSSEDPMNFLAVELSSSSDNSNQCALTSKQDTSNVPRNINSDSLGDFMTIKTKNIMTDLSSKSTSTHEEVASNLPDNATNVFHVGEHDVSKNREDIDAKESCSELTNIELKNRKEAELLAKKNSDSVRYNEEKCDVRVDSRDKWKEELHDKITDPIVKSIQYEITDAGESKQLHNVKEYVTGCTKVEKENVESVDENIVASLPNRSCDMNALRKRERDMTFTLSDDERIGDRSMNVMKSARFGLSETIRCNNDHFDENTLHIEEESQKQEVQSRAGFAKNVNSRVKRSTRLTSKINNNIRKK